ncbi:MAG: tetratricopeptide repeat protein, partial [Alphaproteobacteria bacterium]
LMLVLTVVMFSIWTGVSWYQGSTPGDFEVRQGDIMLSDGAYWEAIEKFDQALDAQPDHRGALHGKAAALIRLERYDDAEALLSYLIEFLNRTLEDDDPTGIGALSAAYTNRGIIRDRQGRHREAYEDYVQSVKIDYEIADGPSWIEHLLYYEHEPSSALKRAQYLYKQFELPEEERLLTLPESDDAQRMYKP